MATENKKNVPNKMVKCVNCNKRINQKTAHSFVSQDHETFLGRLTKKTDSVDQVWCCPTDKCTIPTYRKGLKKYVIGVIKECEMFSDGLSVMYRWYLTNPEGEDYQNAKNEVNLKDENPLPMVLFYKAQVRVYQAIAQDASSQEIAILVFKAKRLSADALEEYHKCQPVMNTILTAKYAIDKIELEYL